MTAVPQVEAPVEQGRAERVAAALMSVGALCAVVFVSAHNAFDLDRFFVPKELALHATAAIAGFIALRAVARSSRRDADRLLFLFLILSAVSAAFATNHWLGLRALAISVSSAVVFWTARALAERGLGDRLVAGAALAVTAAAATALIQAYGIRLDVFSLTRAPGGTLGNRNFVAHAAAFGMPALLIATIRSERRFGRWLAATAIVADAIVLTRSRAAWLAFAAMLVVFAFAILASGVLRRSGRVWRRLGAILAAVAAGVAAALLIPNALHWHSDNPYAETARNVIQYQEGSGHGRLLQYERSLLLALRHPLFGVGPGNWPVAYPSRARAGDPSLDPNDSGMTSNPWPSSDWIAFVVERGPAAAVILALFLARLALAAIRRAIDATDVPGALAAAALVATLTAAVVAGLFDAVLLLGFPALLVWKLLGALAEPVPLLGEPQPARRMPAGVFAIFAVLAAAAAVRSGAQFAAMEIYATRSDRASLERASNLDPGNYRLQMRLARIGKRDRRCEHARAAHDLFPNALAAKELARRCGG